MKSQKARIMALEESTSSDDGRIIHLWEADWAAGIFDHVGTWQRGDPTVELARLAWLHSQTAAVEPWRRGFTFEVFWKVEVCGIDPVFL